jgi:4-hydroxy-tetrahydrodipicolinate reductase
MKIILNGILGRMGRTISTKIIEQKKHQLIGGVDPSFKGGMFPFDVVNSIEDLIEGTDVVIDFSTPEGTEKAVSQCAKYGKHLIVGTTGLNERQLKLLKDASEDIIVVHSNNFSLGVNLLFHFVEYMTQKLASLPFDIEIIESHHRFKKDSPSGTAKTLLQIIQSNLPEEPSVVYGREGFQDSRDLQIGVHSIRGGGIIGIHEVQFLGQAETLSIKHQALSREVFADGVLYCLDRLEALSPGYYTMKDILKL